ncbi:MAG: thioredoxin family protein [Flavobacteriales bacterium]
MNTKEAKNIISIIAISFSLWIFGQNSYSTKASDINWVTIEEADSIQKTHPEKQILVKFYADWCHPCKIMDQTTLQNEEVVKVINENYIPVSFDGESPKTFVFKDYKYFGVKASNGRYANTFTGTYLDSKTSYPSFVTIDNSGKRTSLNRSGYIKKEAFLPYLNQNK